MPIDSATRHLGRSDARHNSTASRRNSSGYLFVPIRDSFPGRPFFQFQVSHVTGELHQATTAPGEPIETTNCLDQLFFDLVDPMRNKLVGAGARNKQTTFPQGVGGLREINLVGVEGLEPPTLSV